MRAAGMQIVLGIDNDEDAKRTFECNFPESSFMMRDIRYVGSEDLENYLPADPTQPLLFLGCAPCQPFTKQNTNRKLGEELRLLLREFGRFVEHFEPTFIFVENVPGIQDTNDETAPFHAFVRLLTKIGYHIAFDTILCQDYGVPQRRKRLVLIASVLGELNFPSATHGPGTEHLEYATVRSAIGDLPPLEAGQSDETVLNHRAAGLAPVNLRRIMATPEGGGRLDWPPELVLNCHNGDYTGHTDVYGRLVWDQPASGLTTRCISLSNGRFGHPVQHRAMSVREAGCLQTFPRNFEFKGSLAAMARQIGNAVPVRVAEVFGNLFVTQWQDYQNEELA